MMNVEGRPIISQILPDCVVAMEAKGDLPGASLLAEESLALGSVSEKRRREFTIARTCARLALSRLGYPPLAIIPASDRQPLWPLGIVGSITHCDGYCAAAVASRTQLLAIGIDAEANAPLPEGILNLVAFGEERSSVRNALVNGICLDRVLFSAKESVFKAWFPLTGTWLDFKDATVCISPESRSFSASIPAGLGLTDGPRPDTMTGRYLIKSGLILTSVVVDRNLQ